jgi:hypothetical protein
MIILDGITINKALIDTIDSEEEVFLFISKSAKKILNLEDLNIIKEYKCSTFQELKSKISGFVSSGFKTFGEEITLYSNDITIRQNISRFLKKRNINVKLFPLIEKQKYYNEKIILFYDIENVSGVKIIDKLIHYIRKNKIEILEINIATHDIEQHYKEIKILKKRVCSNIKVTEVVMKPDSADYEMVKMLSSKTNKDNNYILFTNDNGFIINFSDICIKESKNFLIYYTIPNKPKALYDADLVNVSYQI